MSYHHVELHTDRTKWPGLKTVTDTSRKQAVHFLFGKDGFGKNTGRPHRWAEKFASACIYRIWNGLRGKNGRLRKALIKDRAKADEMWDGE